jgi:hypothetical protein
MRFPFGEREQQHLSQRFVWFAQFRCRGLSRLYEEISLGVAKDDDVLMLAAHADWNQPVPALLLGAVHFLLLEGVSDPLSTFYPSLSEFPNPAQDVYPYFRSFCLQHDDKIRTLISSRVIQSNDVQRCACLMPAFLLVAKETKGRPLFLVEIGSCAGLNLLWDRYRYSYDTFRIGDLTSPVHISSRLHGNSRLELPEAFPLLDSRVGLDLNPIDVHDPEAILWLRALVWPEQQSRATLLQQAVRIARSHTPKILAGDALTTLGEVLVSAPKRTTLCVFKTFVAQEWPMNKREEFTRLLLANSVEREIFLISLEWLGGEYPRLEASSFYQGTVTNRLLAYCSLNCEWIELL